MPKDNLNSNETKPTKRNHFPSLGIDKLNLRTKSSTNKKQSDKHIKDTNVNESINNAKSTDFNFIPKDAYQKASMAQQIFRFLATKGKTIIIFTEAIVLMVFLSRFKLDREIADLKESIENKNAIIESSKSVEKRFKKIQAKLVVIKTIIDNQIDWETELGNFDSQVPNGMVLNSIDYADSSITLSATVDSAEAFASFIGNVVSNQNVKSVTLVSSSYNTDSKQYSFKMNIEREPVRTSNER